MNYFPINFDNASSFIITNNGTAPAPCIVTIIPKVDFLTLTIEGLSEEPIKISSILANSTVVINGEDRTITIDDLDASLRYDAWEFPKLQPGQNTITINNGAQCSVAIEYSPHYI